MSDGERFDTRSPTNIFAHVLTGSGFQLLMNTETSKGFEAWGQLVRREEQLSKVDAYEEELQKFPAPFAGMRGPSGRCSPTAFKGPC